MRGSVVMLVANDVRFDSRVQKQARSAAAAGWTVTVLGVAGRKKPHKFMLEEARVRLLKVDSTPREEPRWERVDALVTAGWRKALGSRAWRRLDPTLLDPEPVFGRALQRLKPDIIHANDFQMLGIGARAKANLKTSGVNTKLVWDAHEYLAGMKPWSAHPRWLPARLDFQREYAPSADALVTVSQRLGEMLVSDYDLSLTPTVVLNAPIVKTHHRSERSIRGDCGLAPNVPLLVYSGGMAEQRGVATVIEALPALAGAHLALVTRTAGSAYVVGLLDRARELGVEDRVHVVGYVAVDDIVDFLSSADIGLIPIHHYPNHEIALITKFLEYSHARLPIVVSDVQTMSEMVRQTGQGEVFRAEDVDSFVTAVRQVFNSPSTYAAAYDAVGLLESWTWDAAAACLDSVYARLHPGGDADTYSAAAS